jgi:hypothetical protein
MFWMAGPRDADSDGAVRLREVNQDRDQLNFTVAKENGGWLQAVWPYQQWEQLASRSVPSGIDTPSWLQDILVARVAVEVRADVLVTSSQALLTSDVTSVKEANPLSPEQALAVIGLFLRNRRQYPMAGPNDLTFGEHLFLWSAARAQLPSGWRWGSATWSPGSGPIRIGRDARRSAAAPVRAGTTRRRDRRAGWDAGARPGHALDRPPSRRAVGYLVEPGTDREPAPGRLPRDVSMHISHEAIYQALYVQGRGAPRRELAACLRTGRALRVPRARPGSAATASSLPRS